MTIVQGPTLANPEAFHTVPELRRELHRANTDLLRYADALAERDAKGLKLVALIHSVLIQHVVSNHHGVAAILETYLDANPKLREGVEEACESQLLQQLTAWSKQEPLPAYNAGAVNPWAMKSVDELRATLDAANRAGIRAIAERKAFERVLAGMASDVSKIVVAHIKNDRDALSRALSEFAEKHVVVRDNTTTTH